VKPDETLAIETKGDLIPMLILMSFLGLLFGSFATDAPSSGVSYTMGATPTPPPPPPPPTCRCQPIGMKSW
jgi:hypothetical protein